jgi:hypothetical protein
MDLLPNLCFRVCKDYVHKFPVSLHDNLQRESHKLYGPPTTITWLQLPRKQTNTGTSTALTAETLIYAHWPEFWLQPMLANVICAWSWRLFEINPAIRHYVTRVCSAQKKEGEGRQLYFQLVPILADTLCRRATGTSGQHCGPPKLPLRSEHLHIVHKTEQSDVMQF